MLSFENILDSAIKRCDDEIVYDEAFCKGFSEIYPFATENISGYINNFELKNKSLLTVGSSGDQVLNAIVNDCEDITVLDINPYTKYYYYLKVAGLIGLSKDKFLNFFRYEDYPNTFKKNKNVFYKEDYEKINSILRLLDYESYLFWDELLNCYSGEHIRNKLFSLDEEKTSTLEKMNPYLENTSFEELKVKLQKIQPKFIIGNVFNEDIEDLGFYDNIWLSNIGTYLSRQFTKIMVDKLSKALNKDGILLISYLYETEKNTEYRDDCSPIYNLPKTLSILREYNPEFISFQGVKGIKFADEDIKDSVLVYKKSRSK